ncbi:hypothetical protein MWU59_10830 [Flavobacteriaceae bacterium F08102]|nr:hypothetical protein [Flavobacteriaceae bacterium F08102]
MKEKKRDLPAPKMYEPSEMALLMRQMHALNEQAKAQIVAGKEVGLYPKELANLHSAAMTDPSERDAEFDSLAVRFLYYQKKAFGPHTEETKVNYNKSIATCIACHQTRCVGPIPKIKKLFID